MQTNLYENSMFTTPSARATLVADGKLCTELFFINFVSFLGLYALNDSRGYMKTYESTEKKLKISEIADDNHDASLIIKLAVDAGVLAEAKTIQATRLLSLIKQRTLRSKDIDSVRVRELLEPMQMHLKPMAAPVKTVVSQFMDAQIDIREYARQIYDVSKNNAWRPYTLEMRTLVLKAQYTEYFAIMKKGGVVIPPTPKASSLKPSVGNATGTPSTSSIGSVPRPVARPIPLAPVPVTPSSADIDKELALIASRAGSDGVSMVDGINLYHANGTNGKPGPNIADLMAAIGRMDFALFKDGYRSPSTPRQFVEQVELRAIAATAVHKTWTKLSLTYNTASPTLVEGRRAGTLAALKSYPLPATAEDMKEFQALIQLNRTVQNGMGTTVAALSPLIKPMEAVGHNIHLKLAFPSPGNGSHLVEVGDLSAKALAWVRKFGAISGNVWQIITSSNLTTTGWGKLDRDAKIMWAANNFTPEGSRKIGSFMQNAMATDPWLATDATITKVASILRDKWNDEEHLVSMNQAGRHMGNMWLMKVAMIAGVASMVEAKAPLKFPDMLKEHVVSAQYGVMPTLLSQLHAIMDAMPCETSSDADKFNQFASTLYSLADLRPIVTDYIDLSRASAKASNVRWLAWSKQWGRNSVIPPGVKGWTSNRAIVDATIASPSVRDFIEKYGMAGAVKISIPRYIATIEEAASVIALYYVTDIGNGDRSVLPAGMLDDLKFMPSDEWYSALKELDASGKYPTLFHHKASYLTSIVETSSYAEIPDGLRAAAGRYFVNEFKGADNKACNTGHIILGEVLPPLTAEKAALIGATAVDYYKKFDHKAINELVRTGIVGGVLNDSTKKLFSVMTNMAANVDPIQFSDVCNAAMSANVDMFKPFVIASCFWAKVLIPQTYAAYRWAWGMSTENVEKLITDSYNSISEVAAKNPTSYAAPWYTPLDIELPDDLLAIGIDPAFRQEVSTIMRVQRFSSSITLSLKTLPWLDMIDTSVLKLPPIRDGALWIDFILVNNSIDQLEGAAKGGEIARMMLQHMIDGLPKLGGLSAHNVDEFVKRCIDFDVPEAEIRKVISATFAQYARKNAKPIDYAELAESLKTNSTAYISVDDIAFVVKKLASSTSKACEEAITALAYTADSNGKVSKDFIAAVRKAGVERATLNRLIKTDIMGQVVSLINADPNGIPLNVTPARMNEFLRYNNVDVSAVGSSLVVSKLEDLGSPNSKLVSIVPPLHLTEDTSPDAIKAVVRELHLANRYNHDPALGLEVKRKFKVSLPGQSDRFDAWLAANPTSKVVTLYHGTGTWAAQFMLRYGFRIIKEGASGVTGRLLGDGIYFADNINKSMLYMSNKGYIRQDGQEGYVFKCKVALGKPIKDYKDKTHTTYRLVSNEWAVFNLDQIVIQEAYHGISRRQSEVQRLLVEEAGDEYVPTVSSFMFMDGMIPITADILVDFEKLPEFGSHVSIESSAKGPIVNIRHDKTVECIERCYRYGEELHSMAAAPDLKRFLDLLHNRY